MAMTANRLAIVRISTENVEIILIPFVVNLNFCQVLILAYETYNLSIVQY